jgi:putative polyketide hydroxylase
MQGTSTTLVRMHDETTPVLIVGGGLVGLSMALFLGQHGVRPLLVERHSGTAIHARTPAYNPRTMELFRAAGLEEEIRQADDWAVDRTGMLWVETLAGKEIGWLEPPEFADMQAFDDVSPSTWALCRQDRLEPILRAGAERFGGDLRFGTRLVSFEQDSAGVTAVLEDRETETRRTVRARYLVNAEGTKSEIRRVLGIEQTGIGVLDRRVSIWFRADLTEARRGRGIVLCMVRNEQVSGTLRVTTGDQAALTVSYHPDRGEGPEDFTGERCVELIRAAVGVPELKVNVEMVTPWDLAAGVARSYRHGAVFLVGDSAHTMPPAGAFGASTGIQESHNLAWKLAFVLSGHADDQLLNTYQAERRPVAELTVNETVARWRTWFAKGPNPGAGPAGLTDDFALIFGYRYRSAAILTEPDEPALLADPRQPTGRPGVRVPHLWLGRDGSRLSTVDLCGPGFVLLTGAAGVPWQEAARRIEERHGLPLTCHLVGADTGLADIGRRWPRAFQIDDSGAVLLRPDGFVAWRTPALAEDPTSVLEGVLLRLLRPDATVFDAGGV